jgi:hypothetical protein
MAQATLRSLEQRVNLDIAHNRSVSVWQDYLGSLPPGEEPTEAMRSRAPRDLTIRTTCFVLADGTVMGSPHALKARKLSKLLEERQRLSGVLSKAKDHIVGV